MSMSGVINVEPRPDSYVLEWRAVEVNDENLNTIKRLLKGLGAGVFADFASDKSDDGALLVIALAGRVFRARPGDFLILSPHDKLMVMDADTFSEQFITEESTLIFTKLYMAMIAEEQSGA